MSGDVKVVGISKIHDELRELNHTMMMLEATLSAILDVMGGTLDEDERPTTSPGRGYGGHL